ncbi:MAG: hypothetical protein RI985_785 [Chloroflexota bacterium]|jgi:hypothetical protein
MQTTRMLSRIVVGVGMLVFILMPARYRRRVKRAVRRQLDRFG